MKRRMIILTPNQRSMKSKKLKKPKKPKKRFHPRSLKKYEGVDDLAKLKLKAGFKNDIVRNNATLW